MPFEPPLDQAAFSLDADSKVPKWRQITEVRPSGAADFEDVRSGVIRLSQDCIIRMRTWLAGQKSAAPGPDGKRAFGSPFWEPVWELAVFYGLPLSKLQAWMRFATGLSASQWYDALRGRDPEFGVRARLRRELEDLLCAAVFHPDADFGTDSLLRVLRHERRCRGITVVGRAWDWGYRYSQRLNLAAYCVTGRTMPQLELELLREVLADLDWDPATCRLFRKGRPPEKHWAEDIPQEMAPFEQDTAASWRENLRRVAELDIQALARLAEAHGVLLPPKLRNAKTIHDEYCAVATRVPRLNSALVFWGPRCDPRRVWEDRYLQPRAQEARKAMFDEEAREKEGARV